jgi:hypothetical protein
MNRLTLTASGTAFLRNMKTCLNWLAMGGEIKLKSGHKILMDDLARPGFLSYKYDERTDETEEMIFQCDSETAWSFLISHARQMSERDWMSMCMNTALNEKD